MALNSNTSFKLSSEEYSIHVFKIIIQKRRYRYTVCGYDEGIWRSRGTPHKFVIQKNLNKLLYYEEYMSLCCLRLCEPSEVLPQLVYLANICSQVYSARCLPSPKSSSILVSWNWIVNRSLPIPHMWWWAMNFFRIKFKQTHKSQTQ